MTKIKEVINIKNKNIIYSVLFLLLLICGLSFGMVFSSLLVIQDSEYLDTPKSSAGEITIVTQENITYTGPMSGYYPATYGFENDADGKTPADWVILLGDPAMYVEIIPELGGHKKVVDMSKGNTGGDNLNIYQYFAQPQEWGTIEFWVRTSDASIGSGWHPGTGVDNVICGVGIDDNQFQYLDDTAWYPIGKSATANTWYHVKIQFECQSGNHYGLNQNTWRAFIDGIEYGDFKFYHNQSDINNFRIHQNWRYSNYHTYTDAIGYSWNSNYNIGDNLNEGLLLSYENSTTLDWKGYSLDRATNKTILGNTTIPMPADGGHKIQVFGNNSIGTMYESNTRYFTVNTAPPDITINSPTDSQIISSTPPSYDLTIAGPYDSIWYALEGGANYTASELTGTIDQSAWSALSDGIITIDFYANNSAGMEGAAQVQVFKDTSEEPPVPPPGISGYNVIALVGVCCIVTLIMVKKKRGRIKP